MGGPCRRPGDAIGRDDRGPLVGVHGQDAAGGVHQMAFVVGVHGADAAGLPVVGAGRWEQLRSERLAAIGHSLAFYRWSAMASGGDSGRMTTTMRAAVCV